MSRHTIEARLSLAWILVGMSPVMGGCMDAGQDIEADEIDIEADETLEAESEFTGAEEGEPQVIEPLSPCEPHIGLTDKQGSLIVGRGSIEGPCPNSTADLIIQEKVGPVWIERSWATVNGTGYDQIVEYDCTGHGQDWYRTKIFYPNVNGGISKYSNEIHVYC